LEIARFEQKIFTFHYARKQMTDIAETKLHRRGVIAGLAVFAGAMAFVAGVFYIAHTQREFELQRWESKLRTASVSPAAKAEQWLADSRDQLRAVAVNPTVQIYLTEAAAPNFNPQAAPDSQAQAAFLAGYVSSLGMRGDFASQGGGLAVLDAHRNVVAATAGFRPSPALIARLVASLAKGAGGQITSAGSVAFLAAVQPMQSAVSAPPVGYVVGERALDASFWASDGSPVAADGGHEALVEAGGLTLIGTSAGHIAASESAGELAAALRPLHLQIGNDLFGENALHLGVPLKGAPWVLVETVPAKTALAGVDARIRSLVVILLLGLLAIIAAIFALWRHNAGLRAVEAREQSVKLYRGLVELLLQAIDQRDPGAAAHSRRVAALSRAMALNLRTPPQEADTIELCGALLNVGKLFVPAGLLTKTGSLDDAERQQLLEGSNRWLGLLAGLSLDPPLEPILRAAHILMQGDRTAGTQFPQAAYIIMTANSAVALMSRRSYRAAHAPDEAIKLLSEGDIQVSPVILKALRDVLATAA
jgi:hypothetical protein